jgi:hypothetical protein
MRYGLSARAPTLAKMSQAFRSLVLVLIDPEPTSAERVPSIRIFMAMSGLSFRRREASPFQATCSHSTTT